MFLDNWHFVNSTECSIDNTIFKFIIRLILNLSFHLMLKFYYLLFNFFGFYYDDENEIKICEKIFEKIEEILNKEINWFNLLGFEFNIVKWF